MEFSFNPDRERTTLTLVMGLLVNGRTIVENFLWTKENERFGDALKEFGLNIIYQGKSLFLEGKGFNYTSPYILPTKFDELKNVLLWTLASKDTESVYTFYSEKTDRIQNAKELLQLYFKIAIESEDSQNFSFRFLQEEPYFKKNSLGGFSYILRNRILLRALLQGRYLNFEEKLAVRDQLTKMFIYFGVSLRYEGRGVEQLSEFERRLLMAQGKKVERTQWTELSETKIITARDYYIPGDWTEALSIILLSTIHGIPKENKILLKNVELNLGRTGALNCFKRMGANIEVVTRREKYGDVFGDIEVFSLEGAKRLQGRRFGEDSLALSFEEYPFLAVAACFAEGETILKLPMEYRKKMRPQNEFLAENLRKTGAEIGVYDDGLVIRGIENVINSLEFECGNSPQIGLALNVLSLALGTSFPIPKSEVVESIYPGILEKLKNSQKIERVGDF